MVFRTVQALGPMRVSLSGGPAARSLRSRSFAGGGFGGRSIEHEGGYG